MIRIYEYGLLDPIHNGDLIDEQFRLAHRYRNKLTEIERRRRETVAAVMVGHPDTEALAAEVTRLAGEHETARAGIQGVRQAARSKEVEKTADARAHVRELGVQLRAARLALKEAKAAIIGDPKIAAALEVAEQTSRQEVRDARATCGTYWGNYLLCEQAADAARKSRTPPKFRRWDGNGAVSVQLQGGLPVDEVFGSDTQIRIERMPVPERYLDARGRRTDGGVPFRKQRSERGERRVARYFLHMRVQSTDKGKPVWATWPLILHRDIPSMATIKVATVQRRHRDLRRWQWRLQLMLDIPESARPPMPEDGAVALNLGWCKRADGSLRAGYVIGSDGYEAEIVVPRSILDRLAKAESLRSICDRNLDALRPRMASALAELEDRAVMFARAGELEEWWRWTCGIGTAITLCRRMAAKADGVAPWWRWTCGLAAAIAQDEITYEARATGSSVVAIPEWLTERVKYMHQWKAADRFRQLAKTWRAQRFPGDAVAFAMLDAWRYRDEHLYHYEIGCARGALLHRREIYRVLAANLSKRYRTLVVDDTDLRDMQRSPRPEDERTELAAAKYQQRVVAPHQLRLTLMQKFAVVDRHDAHDITRCCYGSHDELCGSIETWDRLAAGREHTCTKCDRTWDQDANACRNLLRAYEQRERERALNDARAARSDNVATHKPSRSDRLRKARQKPVPVDALET